MKLKLFCPVIVAKNVAMSFILLIRENVKSRMISRGSIAASPQGLKVLILIYFCRFHFFNFSMSDVLAIITHGFHTSCSGAAFPVFILHISGRAIQVSVVMHLSGRHVLMFLALSKGDT